MQRFSKNRQAILGCLSHTTAHPTAEDVYQTLKADFPDLSLATVYRNLNELVDAGLVTAIGEVNGKERYDGCSKPHPHAVCSSCGKVMDIHSIPMPVELLSKAEEATGFSLSGISLSFTGLCEECRKKKNEETV